MPPSSKTSFGRVFGLVLILVMIVVMTPMVSYLSTVFGWTNPTLPPPGGSGILTAYNGNLGINAPTPSTSLTVGGTISAPIVTDLLAPIASSSAANKAYVDANGGGSGGALTLYGIGLASSTPLGVFIRPGGAINTGCRGQYGGVYTANCTAPTYVNPGENAPDCPSGWTEAMAGYGPMNTMFTWYGTANGDPSGESGDQNEQDVPDAAAIGTDSICSSASFAYLYDVTYAQNGLANGTYGGSGMLSACNHIGCNTCRICIK